MEKEKIYLILENGDVFAGESFGAKGQAIGKLVFNTLMAGYLNTLTDRCYYGQMVVQTFPLIGNYGVIPQEVEGKKSYLSAYVCREICESPSNFRCKGVLSDWLEQQGVVGICGVDTRRLTKTLRDQGNMNGIIVDTPRLSAEQKKLLKSYRVQHALAATQVARASYGEAKAARSVAVVDYGNDGGAVEQLLQRGCRVEVFGADADAKDVLACRPNGIVLTTGAGNPADAKDAIAVVRELAQSGLPIFAFGLGHQLLALARGGKCAALSYAHCGGQPVKEVQSGKLYISSQNHGYCVDRNNLPKDAQTTFVNVNDAACEGLVYADGSFSVQFTPSADGGPIATDSLYDRFIAMTEVKE